MLQLFCKFCIQQELKFDIKMPINLCLIPEIEKIMLNTVYIEVEGGSFKTRSKILIGKDRDREIYLHIQEKMHQG